MSGEQKDEEMIYALTADEHTALQRGLEGLPDTMPPRVVWQRIREQAEAEGLVRGSRLGNRSLWLKGAGVAAAALFAGLMIPGLIGTPQTDFPVVPQNMPSNTTELSALQTLMVQSRQLENDLRALPEEPRVLRAGTVATISGLQDRIAAIDYQLNDPEVQMTLEDRELFWRERVRLMKSLLQLRYAQAQRAVF
jgi:hypothetical protein